MPRTVTTYDEFDRPAGDTIQHIALVYGAITCPHLSAVAARLRAAGFVVRLRSAQVLAAHPNLRLERCDLAVVDTTAVNGERCAQMYSARKTKVIAATRDINSGEIILSADLPTAAAA